MFALNKLLSTRKFLHAIVAQLTSESKCHFNLRANSSMECAVGKISDYLITRARRKAQRSEYNFVRNASVLCILNSRRIRR